MIKVVGIRFRNAGKIYFFAPGEFELKRGSHVIVETARGIEFGTCVNDPREVTDDQIVSPLKPILRIASEHDEEQARDNRAKEKEAFALCKQKIIEHQLEMKLIDAEYTFDNSKILFYFTADGRIDFRDLVKDLAGIFRTRIELRQVGVRDETKIIGGIGICGRPLCCHSYLSDFVPVSIKMAKEQNLSLNPTKISGVCGRLMCCLKNEEDVYEEQNRKLPTAGDYVTTALGERGVVTSVNIFRETVKVLVQNGDEKELKEYSAEDIRFKKHRKRGKTDLSPEELEQLKALEPDDVSELGSDDAKPVFKSSKAEKNEDKGENADEKREDRRGDRRGDRKNERHGDRSQKNDSRQDRGDRQRGGDRHSGEKQDRAETKINVDPSEKQMNDAGQNTNEEHPNRENRRRDNRRDHRNDSQNRNNNRNDRNRDHNGARDEERKNTGDSAAIKEGNAVQNTDKKPENEENKGNRNNHHYNKKHYHHGNHNKNNGSGENRGGNNARPGAD